MPLDSDIQNGDSALSVTFYENLKSGVPKVYCRIDIPGDKTQVWDQPATEDEKRRFPQHWLRYCMDAGNTGVMGTPLSDWVRDQPEVINDNQAQALFAMGFRSCEQLANASDAQLQRIGMGAAGLQQNARTYLKTRNHNDVSDELTEARAKMAAMEGQMAEMMAFMREHAPAPKVDGRRRKVAPDGKLDADSGDAGHG